MGWRNLGFIVVCLCGLGFLASHLVPRDLPRPDALQVALSPADSNLQELVAKLDDQFQQSWAAANVVPTATVDEWTVYRRLSLALTGTIPSLEEIRWLQGVPSEQRLGAWLNRLLSDRRFSDYLAERLARAYVGTEDGPFLVYRRRRFVTWLSDQIHDGRRYDDLVRELISGTGLWTDSPAVNFLTVTNDVNGDEQPDEQRLAARTARAFLGVRLDCVQCHDDNLGGDWLQRDFQQLAAYYADATSSLLGVRDRPQDYEFQYLGQSELEKVPACVPFEPDLASADGTRRKQLADWVTHPQNEAFGRALVNRIWALMCGRPLISPVDDLPLQGPYPPGLELLARDFAQHDFDLRRLVRAIASSCVFQRDSRSPSGVSEQQEEHWAAFPLTRLRPEQVAGILLQAASLTTIDANSHILVRLGRYEAQQNFVRRYGDTGEDEFSDRAGTIPQRLLLMNGELVSERTKDDLVKNAVTRLAVLAHDNLHALEAAYWATLTRQPLPDEREYFLGRLDAVQGQARRRVLEDLYWALFNSAEFSWNH